MKLKSKKTVFSDDEVISSVKEGRVQNFEILLERYKTRIINFVFRMVGDYDEAQNISQEVFLKVYKNIDKYRENGSFQSFIFTIAKNMTLNHIKKQSRITFFSALSKRKGEERFLSVNSTQAEDIEKKEKDKQVADALRELSENQRIALIMKVYLEFSYKRIHEITGWSIPKIETLISRAKQTLKKKIILQESRNRVVK